ncbi:MAG TPA: hypothetical protein VIK53_01255 [Verrucomicrobiae bacterium]
MVANITEELDLLLRWNEAGDETIVHFSLWSSSEFVIKVQTNWRNVLNYQGDLKTSFETTCYGFDLDVFLSKLNDLTTGKNNSAQFSNTGEDFEITFKSKDSFLFAEIRYCHVRVINDVSCDCELVLPIGALQIAEATQLANSIRDILRLLKVDCRSLHELPHHFHSPNFAVLLISNSHGV